MNGSPSPAVFPEGTERLLLPSGFLTFSDVRLHPRNQTVHVERTCLACDLPSCPKDGKRGDAHDIEPAGDPLLLIGIDFCKTHLRLQLCSCLSKGRCHHLARSAPGSPEIHDHRDIASGDVPVKGRTGQFHRLTVKKPAPALAALRPFRQFGSRQPVYARAGRTDNVQRINHDLSISGNRQNQLREKAWGFPEKKWTVFLFFSP